MSDSPKLPPSGPWSGYYLYEWGGPKHRMKLSLLFSANGRMDGDGVDDIAPFIISGVFDGSSLEAIFTKTYIGMHSVEYRGVYDLKSISGAWTLRGLTGDFRIWPGAADEGQEETANAEVEEPAELVLT